MFNLILNDLKKRFEGKILLTPSNSSELNFRPMFDYGSFLWLSEPHHL
jgi:hypothetical protein